MNRLTRTQEIAPPVHIGLGRDILTALDMSKCSAEWTPDDVGQED